MRIHTSSAPLRLCYVHLEHGSLIFLSEKWGSMSFPEIMWHETSDTNRILTPKAFQNHISNMYPVTFAFCTVSLPQKTPRKAGP